MLKFLREVGSIYKTLLRYYTQRSVVIPCQRFGAPYRSHLGFLNFQDRAFMWSCNPQRRKSQYVIPRTYISDVADTGLTNFVTCYRPTLH